MRVADIEVADDIHRSAVWTVEECRRRLKHVQAYAERYLGESRVTREVHEQVRGEARRPMPTWDVIVELLSIDEKAA